MTGAQLLARFLARSGISQAEAAETLGVSPSVMHYWTHGSRPREAARLRIETWSSGAVPASSWLTRRERASIARTRPASMVARAPKGGSNA